MAETLLDMLEGCKPGNTRKMTYKGAYRFLYALLTNRAVSLFDWQGLPFEQHELEIPMQMNGQGYTGVVYSETLARWLVANGSGVGVTEYPDKWLTYTWACPLTQGVGTIDQSAFIARNNSILMSSRFMIDHYAHLMAHALLSMQAILINSRATGFATASDDQKRKRLLAFYQALEEGKTDVILSDETLEGTLNQKPFDFISDKISGNGSNILDYWQLFQNLYKDFLAMIGVSKSTDKRERLITSEVAQDLPLYRFNIEDMLDQRKKLAADLSKAFGHNVTVDLAESVKQSQEVPNYEPIGT